MTKELTQAIGEDLAFIRALAQEGRRTPVLGGAILAGAGFIYGLAAVAHWSVAVGVVEVGPLAYWVIWGAALVAFFTLLFWVTQRLKGAPGAQAMPNRAMSAVWAALGGASSAVIVGLFIAGWRLDQFGAFVSMIPTVILALHGAGWSVASALSDRPWVKWVAGGSYLAAVGLAAMIGQAEQWLAYGAALVLLVGLPGLAMLRPAPAKTV